MNTIIIYGEKNDLKIRNNLIAFLKSNYDINTVDGSNLYHNGTSKNKKNSVLIISTNQIKNIDISNSIIIIGDNAKINHIKHINNQCRMIVNSDNIKQINKLGKFSSKIYTCGFSSKDFITFSSRSDDDAVVSLQREVHLDDYSCEPFEIPCLVKEKQSDYHILSTAMALVLIKCLNEKKACNISKIYF